MRKFVVLLGLALFTTFAAEARRLTPSESLDRAFAKMQSGTRMRRCRTAKSKVDEMQLRTTLSDSKQIPLVYVYDLPQGGFMLTSGDTRAHALLGYAEGADFDAMQQNPAFMSWLQQCREALAWLAQQPEMVAVEHRETQLTSSVEPLLGDIAWSQDAPYNDLCPLRENNKGEMVHAVTGCTATAMTQVMCYHQWPQQGTGQHTNQNDRTQVVDFTQSTYDWSLFKHQYQKTEKGAAAEAVARLMYDAGCALDMNYGVYGSSSCSPLAVHALTEHFGYNKSMTVECRVLYTTEAWNELLRNELDAQRPIVFSACSFSYGDGHAFVIDGYDTNGLYHVNWGYGGTCNNYFDINYLLFTEPGIGASTGGYNVMQDAIIGVQKDEDGSSVAVTNLIIEKYLQYKPKEDLFAFSVCNRGGNPFTGVVGYALYDENREKVREYRKSYAEHPISVTGQATLTFASSDLGTVKPGYTLRPVYADSEDGALQPIRTPISAPSYLQYMKKNGTGSWGAPSDMALPMLQVIDSKVVNHTCQIAPSFELTIVNDKDCGQEYNQYIEVDVYKGNKLVCGGAEQMFLQPGESKTVTVECNLGEYQKMTAGRYGYVVFLLRSQTYERIMDTKPFDMVDQSAETAVDKVANDTEHTGKVYDLTGRLVQSAGKRGFYILNGRKHISTK